MFDVSVRAGTGELKTKAAQSPQKEGRQGVPRPWGFGDLVESSRTGQEAGSWGGQSLEQDKEVLIPRE